MWPKLLDLSPDECRGMLRRLELQSYSQVVSTFRAQGILNEMKMKVLRDLREAFHITDDRHKAEVRRVVNDEAFSTIAKVVYGPNSEIEWNKEGARGFSLLTRTTPQTALSLLADKAAELGDQLNAKLPLPSNTQRDYVLRQTDADTETSTNVVIADPLQVKLEMKRQHMTSPTKARSTPVDWTTTNKSSRKRSANKTNSTNSTPRIQQLSNTLSAKIQMNSAPQRKTIQPPASTKSAATANRRRKSELILTPARSTETVVDHSTQDNEQHPLENEINSVPLPLHQFNRNATQNDANVQMATVTHSPVQIQQTLAVVPLPNATTNTSRIGTTQNIQTQAIYQQQVATQKQAKATPAAAVVTTNSQHEKPMHQMSNGGHQFVSHKPNSNLIQLAAALPSPTTPPPAVMPTATAQRIPPKINILSQQTITKSNINFVPMTENNKIIIKSDSKLANAFKSQKIQMIPGQMTATPTATANITIAAAKPKTQNNLIIHQQLPHSAKMHPKVITMPLNANHQNAQAFYVNMPTTQSPTSNVSMHTIEKVITDESPVEIITTETDDFIIEDTIGAGYELIEQNVDDTAAYVTTTTTTPTTANIQSITRFDANHAKRNHEHRQRTSFVTPKVLSNVASNEYVSTIIYEEHPIRGEWGYEVEYEHDTKSNGNGQPMANDHAGEIIVEENTMDYHDANIIYAEEDDENVLQEEYVTTEVFSPNDNVIEMEIDSVNHAHTYHDVY